jgi:hypothetical protein
MIPLLDDVMGADKLLQSPLSHRYTLSARRDTYGLRQAARAKRSADPWFIRREEQPQKRRFADRYVHHLLEVYGEILHGVDTGARFSNGAKVARFFAIADNGPVRHGS